MTKRGVKIALARGNRHDPTPAEAAAWALLRNRRCLGLKFRRQHVIRGFIVDFYCAEFHLALEVDGGVHGDRVQAEFDEARSRALASVAQCVRGVAAESRGSARPLKAVWAPPVSRADAESRVLLAIHPSTDSVTLTP